jgi:hypothetical protein
MIENNPVLFAVLFAGEMHPGVRGETRDYGPKAGQVRDLVQRFVVAIGVCPQTIAADHRYRPPQLWITLWATGLGSAGSREKSGHPTNCSKFRHENSVENQSLA